MELLLWITPQHYFLTHPTHYINSPNYKYDREGLVELLLWITPQYFFPIPPTHIFLLMSKNPKELQHLKKYNKKLQNEIQESRFFFTLTLNSKIGITALRLEHHGQHLKWWRKVTFDWHTKGRGSWQVEHLDPKRPRISRNVRVISVIDFLEGPLDEEVHNKVKILLQSSRVKQII